MATYRASATATGNDSAPTVTKPTGTVDGDVVLWVCYITSDLTITAPTGFTLVRTNATFNGGDLAIYKKVAASDGASYAGSLGASRHWICGAVTLQGTAPDVEQSAQGSNGVNGTGNAIIPAMTTTRANSVIILFELEDDALVASSWTPDGATTERFDLNSDDNTGSLCCDTADVTTAQAYGSWTLVSDTSVVGTNRKRYCSIVVSDPAAATLLPLPGMNVMMQS